MFDNERDQRLFEAIISSRAEFNKKTQSAEIFDIITSKLPKNSDMRRFCEELYLGANVISILEKIFANYAALLPEEGEKNGKSFVIFLKKVCVNLDYNKSKDEGEKKYLIRTFNNIVTFLKQAKPLHNGDSEITNPVKYASCLLDEVEKEPQFFVPVNLVHCFLLNWNYIPNKSYIYRALSSLCRILQSQINDSIEDRIKLIDLIEEISQTGD